MADRYPYHSDPVGARDHGAPRGADNDPLAELARLIGQTDPNAFGQRPAAQPRQQTQAQPHYHDQYQDQYQEQQPEAAREEPAPPSWMRAAASTSWPQHAAPAEPPPQDQVHYADEQDQQNADMPSFLRTARQQHDTSRYDQVLYDQNAQNEAPPYADGQYQYQDGYQDQADPNAYPGYYADTLQEEPKKRRGGLTTVVAVLALAIVGTAAAYGYRAYTGAPRTGEPPVVKAEPGPTKIVPPTQTTDASGKIVDRISGGASGGPGGERVLSREEQPIDINGRNAPRVVFPPLNQGGSTPQAMAAAAPTAVAATPQAVAANGALGDEPKRVRTLAIRPDQPDAVPQQSSSPPPRPTQARAQVPPSSTGPMSIAPQSNADATPVRTAAVAPASTRAGGYMVQVSSQRSEADAQASYRAMQSKFPNVLGSRNASIRRADLGEKGVYYRAMVGPFAAAEEAGNLCNSLKSAGGQCVVQRN